MRIEGKAMQRRGKSERGLLFLMIWALWLSPFCVCEAVGTDESNPGSTFSDALNGIYEISEFLNEALYDEYMQDDGTGFDRLSRFQSRFSASEEFDFYAFANNFIEVVGKPVPESGIVNHGTPYEADSHYFLNGESLTAAEAIQISDNYFSLFPITIAKGRGFSPADFESCASDPIPVILGSAYREQFDTGDRFEGDYICEKHTFAVIGFAEAGSRFFLPSHSKMEAYDHFIILPFRQPDEDSFSARAILLQQICGLIVPRQDRDSAVLAIRKMLKEAGLESWIDMICVNDRDLSKKMR